MSDDEIWQLRMELQQMRLIWEQRICLCGLTGRYHVVDKDSCCEICSFPENTKPFGVVTVNEVLTNCFDEIDKLRMQSKP